jgi:NADH:ubiquinone oxidoreductase subunit B-like Fe-S oxidoreductase
METDYGGFKTTKFDSVVNWSRKFSLFQYPFVTACCGMEYMAPAHIMTFPVLVQKFPDSLLDRRTFSG